MDKFINSLTGKKVLIMGLGRNNGGYGSTIFALKSGASEIMISDMKHEDFSKPSVDKINAFLLKNKINISIKYIFGGHTENEFLWADVVIKNPAVKFSNSFINLAINNGALIETEITLFLKTKNTKSRVIGVSGSKGKSSTTKLIYHELEFAVKKSILDIKLFTGGNMGISLLDTLDQSFEGIYVLELSSFVTEAIYIQNLTIDFYLLTNLYPDHLNYYSSLEEYYQAKVNLIKNLNPQNVYINSNSKDLELMTTDYKVNKIDTKDQDRLIFPDFFNNALIQNSILVSRFLNKEFKLDYDLLNEGLQSFKVVEGRFEIKGKIQRLGSSIEFINDTCASIPQAAITGLDTLQNQNKNIFLITGGSDKGLDFEEFFIFINKYCTKIYLMRGGNTFELFEQKIDKSKLIICDTLKIAVEEAFKDAQQLTEATIILSRGCASFGIALNEFEMGKEFDSIFEKLKSI